MIKKDRHKAVLAWADGLVPTDRAARQFQGRGHDEEPVRLRGLVGAPARASDIGLAFRFG